MARTFNNNILYPSFRRGRTAQFGYLSFAPGAVYVTSTLGTSTWVKVAADALISGDSPMGQPSAGVPRSASGNLWEGPAHMPHTPQLKNVVP
eukprot:320067-Pyramimonas_sp.AAC.1